jgi:hypothetical protein
MQYLLMIFDDPTEVAKLDAAEQAEIMPGYRAFDVAIRESGNYCSGAPLEPPTTATTVRLRGGRRLITDGPFAETKEHMVGYYLVEAADLDAAIALAARIPSARFGAVEVRPLARLS